MPQQSSISLRERLKAETRDDHAEAERVTRLTDRLSDPTQYLSLLKRLFGYYEPAETSLRAAHGNALNGLNLADRQRTFFLWNDLHACGLSTNEIMELPRCRDLPEVGTVPGAIGYLYVTEGSSLGGTVLARQLDERLQLGPENGASFFTLYGDQVGVRWKEFLEVLNSITTSEDADTVVRSARDTFARFSAWIGGDRE